MRSCASTGLWVLLTQLRLNFTGNLPIRVCRPIFGLDGRPYMRIAAAISLCLLLVAPIGELYAQPATAPADKAWVEAHIGKEFWVHPASGNLALALIQQPSFISPKRPPVFQVSKVERITVVRPGNPNYAIVRLDDGVEAGVAVSQLREASPTAKPSGTFNPITSVSPARTAKREGVSIGMTKEEVLRSSWGKPREINQTHTGHGTTEQWVYGGGYLYFRNGRLNAVQN